MSCEKLREKIDRSLGRINALTGDPGGSSWPERLQFNAVPEGDFLAVAVKVGSAVEALRGETQPLLEQRKGEFVRAGNSDGFEPVAFFPKEDEKSYTIADIVSAVGFDGRLGFEDVNELVQMLGRKNRIHVRKNGTFVEKEDFDQVVGAARVLWGNELSSKLTLVVLSPFITHYTPDPEVIAAEGSDTQQIEIKVNPSYREIMNNCLPNDGDEGLLREIIDSDLGEKMFMRMVVGTLEELWGRAEAISPKINREEMWDIINHQWWEMTRRSERYTSGQWHIIARCVLLQKQEVTVGSIVRTFCDYFNVAVPDKYKDCEALKLEQGKREARLAYHQRREGAIP